MKVTPESLALLAARVGMASAKELAQLTVRERLTADLQTQQALVRSVKNSIEDTHPIHRKPVRQRLAAVQARVRALLAALKPDRDRSSVLPQDALPKRPLRSRKAGKSRDAG